jgi:DnaK suppressor protein
MKKVFLNKIKKILKEEQKEIISRVNINSTNNLIDVDGDDVDVIQAKILALTDAQLIARDKEKILKIENALKKIVDGSFGYCEECGEEIAEKRLLINPGFITCIGCAEKLELMRKRGGTL